MGTPRAGTVARWRTPGGGVCPHWAQAVQGCSTSPAVQRDLGLEEPWRWSGREECRPGLLRGGSGGSAPFLDMGGCGLRK